MEFQKETMETPVRNLVGAPRAGEERLRDDIEGNLRSGEWREGTKLPTERALSEAYSVSRAKVRRVLNQFEREGRISRTVGSGTFVNKQSNSISEDIEAVSPQELMEVRLLIEPQLADLIVKRASIAELAHLKELVELGKRATTMNEFEELDHRFHMALTLAAKNDYLTLIMRRIQAVRESPEWISMRRRGLNSDRQKAYAAEHEKIVTALRARDAGAARSAIVKHLSSVGQNLTQ